MGNKRKPGAGRKPVPDDLKKKQLAFRAEGPVIAALKRLAKKHDRLPSAETLHAVKKHLREYGELADETK